MGRTMKKRTINHQGSTGTIVTKKKPLKKKTVVEVPPVKEMAACYFCKKEVEKAEFECSGCGEVVCDPCDEFQPWGSHDVEEHTMETEDD